MNKKMNKKEYLSYLNCIDHYTNFKDVPIIPGWNSNSSNFSIVKGKKTLLEIDSWTGGSAKTIASMIDEDSILFCVDTFLGSHEHLLDNTIPLENNRSLLFDMFLKNTKEYKDKIIPFQITSNSFSVYAFRKNLKFDFIYIDGDHTTIGVYNDLNNYYPLLNEKGIILGDDYSWDTVKEGLNKFCSEKKIEYSISEGQYIIQK